METLRRLHVGKFAAGRKTTSLVKHNMVQNYKKFVILTSLCPLNPNFIDVNPKEGTIYRE